MEGIEGIEGMEGVMDFLAWAWVVVADDGLVPSYLPHRFSPEGLVGHPEIYVNMSMISGHGHWWN